MESKNNTSIKVLLMGVLFKKFEIRRSPVFAFAFRFLLPQNGTAGCSRRGKWWQAEDKGRWGGRGSTRHGQHQQRQKTKTKNEPMGHVFYHRLRELVSHVAK